MQRLVFLMACSALTSIASGADGKLLGTGGLLSIEGSAGGGITPWAVITGYGEADQIGVSAALSRVDVQDFELSSGAVALGWRNRLELSLARQQLDVPGTMTDTTLAQTIYGLKVRLGGDLIYGQWPQLSAGVQYKSNSDGQTLAALGVRDQQDLDYTLSLSRLFLNGPFSRNFLLNLGLRSTKAQQTGLLGFSATRHSVFEGSAALLLNRSLAVGVEFREKPDALVGITEQHWRDVFIA